MSGVWIAVGGFIGATLGTILTGCIVEWYRQNNRLRLTAIDKRLEVHQEAYTLFVKLWISTRVGSEEQVSDIRDECFEWWAKSCLYLSKKTRQKFVEVCFSTDTDSDRILNVCAIIAKEIGLPSSTEQDFFPVAKLLKPLGVRHATRE